MIAGGHETAIIRHGLVNSPGGRNQMKKTIAALMMACAFALTGCGTSTTTEAPTQEQVQQTAEKVEEVQ